MLLNRPSICAPQSSLRSSALALGAMLLMLLTAASARAEFKLTIDFKDGDKIHDVTKVVAHAESSDGIDKVEFFVDDQLKVTANGIPYTYTWDTIADKEGQHTLAVTAYDANGQTKKLTVSVEIDNELGMGAEALAKTAHTALLAGDTEKANAYARRSLKADSTCLLAARVTAALAARDFDWDKAVAALEKGAGYDSEPESIAEMCAYKMKRALRPENAASFVSLLQSIQELRQKGADKAADRVKAKEAGNHEAIGDALINAGRFKEAQMEYQKAGDNMPVSTANRVAFAYALQDNTELAIAFVRPLLTDKRADQITRAIYGLALLRKQKFAEARTAVEPDLGSGYAAANIIAAYADIVEGNSARALTEAQAALAAAPKAADAVYLNSMLIKNLTDSEAELVKSITMAPFQSGPYVDFAARVALQKNADRMEDGLKLTEMVLTRGPDNVGAKLAKILMLTTRNRDAEAEPILDALARKSVAPDVEMIAAIFLNHKNQVGRAQQYWDAARRQDNKHFDFLVIPAPLAYLQDWERKTHYRSGFFLTFESLMAAKPAAAAPADGNAAQ
jgi:Bacterial Ig domain